MPLHPSIFLFEWVMCLQRLAVSSEFRYALFTLQAFSVRASVTELLTHLEIQMPA